MKNFLLIDTNVIVYALDIDSPFHKKSKELLEAAMLKKINAAIADKSLFELNAIITDEKRVNHPATSKKAFEIVNFIIESEIEIIYTTRASLVKTLELGVKYNIKKQDIFDFVLIGIMLINNINKITTYNIKDFEKVKEIEVTQL